MPDTPAHPEHPAPSHIAVRGARVHNLRGIDVDIPLRQLVAIGGVSGSGKSSLAHGVLYAEGSRRYLEALSTYTRRRLSQAPRAAVDAIEHVPAALALRQRPPAGGVRSTFGTSTELLNVIRLMFSRLASYECPSGHRVPPALEVAEEQPFACPECGEQVRALGAEELSFNAGGACPTCQGVGTTRTVDDAALVPDESLTIDEGAVAPWNTFGFNVQPDIVREFGVPTDIPFSELTPAQREIVFAGPEEKKHIVITSKKGVHDLDFTFRNARLTVLRELERATDDKRLKRLEKFLVEGTCPDCQGTRLNPAARSLRIGEDSLADVTALPLEEVVAWAPTVPATLPETMHPMADTLIDTLQRMAARLLELGLGYLGLDRPSRTLSTGERQRVQLARAVRNRTTGVLYVLDEPSIGLHPANLEGLLGVMRDLLTDGNSVVFVDHDVQVLAAADHLIEIGPGSGSEGGRIIAQGTLEEILANEHSLLAGFLDGSEPVIVREQPAEAGVFSRGTMSMGTAPLHTVHALETQIPRGRLVAVTGVSGSGKTTLVLESLVPALQASAQDEPLPAHVTHLDAEGIRHVHVVDASPVGATARSTVGTYSKALDELRRIFAALPEAHAEGRTAGDFSFNTGALQCPRCQGTGSISLDVQFLPDVDIVCPECHGSRYAPEADAYRLGGVSLPELLGIPIRDLVALPAVEGQTKLLRILTTLDDLGLGYLTLGEDTPALSGGEAQRLKLSTQLRRRQDDAVFVLDEPSVGLHPRDVRTLLEVLERLVERGATVLVIEHDLDVIANADWVIDMGPGGGEAGGRIVGASTPQALCAVEESVTGRFLRRHLG